MKKKYFYSLARERETFVLKSLKILLLLLLLPSSLDRYRLAHLGPPSLLLRRLRHRRRFPRQFGRQPGGHGRVRGRQHETARERHGEIRGRGETEEQHWRRVHRVWQEILLLSKRSSTSHRASRNGRNGPKVPHLRRVAKEQILLHRSFENHTRNLSEIGYTSVARHVKIQQEGKLFLS